MGFEIGRLEALRIAARHVELGLIEHSELLAEAERIFDWLCGQLAKSGVQANG